MEVQHEHELNKANHRGFRSKQGELVAFADIRFGLQGSKGQREERMKAGEEVSPASYVLLPVS